MLGQGCHVDISCLDFCTVAATHQEIRPKPLILLSVIRFFHALSFVWRILCARKRVMSHTNDTCITQYFSGILFLVRDCVGELRIPGLHTEYFGGT